MLQITLYIIIIIKIIYIYIYRDCFESSRSQAFAEISGLLADCERKI